MIEQTFTPNEIPYERLEYIGLSQEMVDSLPEEVMQKLLMGMFSPLLPLSIPDEEGNRTSVMGRIALVRLPAYIDVVVSTANTVITLDGFTEEEQSILRGGQPIQKMMGDTLKYAQLDDKTNNVMSIDASVIHHNLKVFFDIFNLPSEAGLHTAGDRITFNFEDKLITYGVDLQTTMGIRAVVGDKISWIRDKEQKPKEMNFGMYGCWRTDENGDFKEYIPEEDYTIEMENELSRQGNENVEEEIRTNRRR